MKNVSARFIKATSKNGKEFEALQFEILTPSGIYQSCLSFPSQLEKGIIKKAISENIGAIYGEASPEVGFENEL